MSIVYQILPHFHRNVWKGGMIRIDYKNCILRRWRFFIKIICRNPTNDSLSLYSFLLHTLRLPNIPVTYLIQVFVELPKVFRAKLGEITLDSALLRFRWDSLYSSPQNSNFFERISVIFYIYIKHRDCFSLYFRSSAELLKPDILYNFLAFYAQKFFTADGVLIKSVKIFTSDLLSLIAPTNWEKVFRCSFLASFNKRGLHIHWRSRRFIKNVVGSLTAEISIAFLSRNSLPAFCSIAQGRLLENPLMYSVSLSTVSTYWLFFGG